MPRGRKPIAQVAAVDLPAGLSEVLAQDSQTMNEQSSIAAAVIGSAELFKLVGRIQAAHFLETVSSKVMAQAYLQVVEEFKKIKHLAVAGRDGKWKHVSSVDEFCREVLGVSARRCRQIVLDVRTLGEDLYEQAESIGFRSRDYQALRALPTDDQDLVKQAIATESKEQVLELLNELAARNQMLRETVQTAREDLAAKDELVAAKNSKIDSLLTKKRWKPSADGIAQTEAEQGMLDQLAEDARRMEVAVARFKVTCMEVLSQAPAPIRACAGDVMQYVLASCGEVVAHYNLAVDMVGAQLVRPSWMEELPATGTAQA